MMSAQDHRVIHNLNIPYECNGFKIDDYVEYIKDEESRRGYIYCFRPFGYNWFAWIYFDKNNLQPSDCIYVGDLTKIKE